MEPEYFKNYCERGAYADHWEQHSGFQDCITAIDKLKLKDGIHTIRVLGSADSNILDAFEREHFIADGIEICPDIVPTGDPRVTIGDMLFELPRLFSEQYCCDLLFSNSLVYLEQDQIVPFLGLCSHVAPYFHYSCSTTECPAPDPWRKTLMPQTWWNEMFQLAGWEQTAEPFMYESRMYD